MSVIMPNGESANVPRPEAAELWSFAFKEWADGDQRRIRNLAIFVLCQFCRWPQPTVAELFGLTQGRVSQLLGEIVDQIGEVYLKQAGVSGSRFREASESSGSTTRS